MLGFKRLKRTQPKTKKKIVETVVSNWIGRRMRGANWGAFTIPFPYVIFIFYWEMLATDETPQLIRLHEFQHVYQDEANSWFLASWVKYLLESWRHLKFSQLRQSIRGAFMAAYALNRFEIAAYEYVADVEEGRTECPDWCKPLDTVSTVT